jgi:hypothetical protein
MQAYVIFPPERTLIFFSSLVLIGAWYALIAVWYALIGVWYALIAV